MNTNTLLIAAAAFGAGYFANKLYADKSAAVGASYFCQNPKNFNHPACQGGNYVHTLILPIPARRTQGNVFTTARVAGL